MTTVNLFTLVQHSGFLVGEKPGFRAAVEVQSVVTKGEQHKVEKAGGLLFSNYGKASDAEDTVNYPDNRGMYPHAEGTFGVRIADGRPVYIPSQGDRDRLTPSLVVFS